MWDVWEELALTAETSKHQAPFQELAEGRAAIGRLIEVRK